MGADDARGGISMRAGLVSGGLVVGSGDRRRCVAMRITKAMAPAIMKMPNRAGMVTERDVAIAVHLTVRIVYCGEEKTVLS